MHILLMNTLYPPILFGGAEKSVSLLAEALVRSGDQVTVISLHAKSEETVEMLNGVRVYRLPMDNRYWPFHRSEKPGQVSRLLWHIGDIWNSKAAKRIGQILDQEKPDVVHTNNILGFSVAAWGEVKKRNIRLVHTLRDYYMLCSRCALFRNGSTCAQRCIDCKALTLNRKLASHAVDAVVSNSEYVLKAHTSCGYFSSVPSAVIFNIVDYLATPEARVSNDDTLVFGYIGKVEDEKGIQIVLEATERLANPNWRLLIAGAGFDRYVNDLKRRYSDPRIEWLGFVSSQKFYRSIDTTLVSSVWPEPLPRTLIETFAAGKSAICADSGGIPEIASLGKVVVTYPATNVEALGIAMNRALADVPRWRSGGFRDAKAMEHFSEARITDLYRSVYRADQPTRSAVHQETLCNIS